MSYALYYATAPAPADLTTHDALNRLVPVLFSTEKDALHTATGDAVPDRVVHSLEELFDLPELAGV